MPADETNRANTNPNAPCERAYELLNRLNRSGAEADGVLVQELADHLEECARCHEDEEGVEGLVSLYKSFSSSYGPPVPSSLEQQLLDAMCGQNGRNSRYGVHGPELERSDTMDTIVASQLKGIKEYGFGTSLDIPIDQAIERVTAALKEEGFGVLTTIDVRQTMKQKLDIDFEPYYILGACNPRLAYRALETDHDIGLLLPCNVIVHAHGERTRVDMVDPIAMLGVVQNKELDAIAQEARSRLKSALQRLETGAE